MSDDTKTVVDRHLKAFVERNLEGTLADYAADAVLFTPFAAIKGVESLRGVFAQIFAEFGKPGAVFTLTMETVEGDYAYIIWTGETADNVYEMASDTFVVRDGKIVAQSFAGKITPRH
jgi:ketosteroid isomerase-like protein